MALLRMLLGIVPLVAWLGYMFLKRKRFEQFKSFPRLTPDLIWGHLKTVDEGMKAEGKDKHLDYAFQTMHAKAGSPELLLFDMRPVFPPLLVIFSHALAEQISKPSKTFKYSVTKSPTMQALRPIIGPTSIIYADGETWKHLRKRFNPGFAHTHLTTLIPAIISKTKTFLERLDRLSELGSVFEMDELCTSLTFDIIGAVVLDVDFKAQYPLEQQNAIVRQYRLLTSSFDDNAPFQFLAWRQRKRQRLAGEAVDHSIKAVVTEKFAELKDATQEGKESSSGRSVLELSLQGVEELTKSDLQETADQVKSFLFAGHDTTSIVLQWAFYNLSIHPQVLNTLRNELDTVFGPDKSADSVTDQLLQRGEEALKKLTYTSAVVKEILRLYPPAGSARMAHPGAGLTIRLENGEDVCIDGHVVYLNHYNIQRDPAVYGDSANDFVPERWLGDTDTSMEKEYATTDFSSAEKGDVAGDVGGQKIPPSAWRPFERGPRNCIGQELANLEVRIILACTVRRYDFQKVGLGEVKLAEDGRGVQDAKGRLEVKEELFNRRQVTSKPFDGTQMKVKLAEY